MKKKPDRSFSELAAGKQKSLPAEFIYFLMHNKKWWITPIFVVLVLLSVLIFLGGSGVAPFIYTLF